MIDRSQSLSPRQLSGEVVSPSGPAARPGHDAQAGRWARVEPLDPVRHGPDLYAASHGLRGGERIWDYLGYGPFADLSAFKTWLDGCAASSDPLFFALRDTEDGRAKGMASYLNIAPSQRSIEIGHIWLGPAFQRSRAATEALFLLMRHALEDLGYRRLEWKCNALNEASRRAADRLGFAYEGTFYQHMIVKGRNRDTAWFSILDGEWPMIRANFDRWLAPDNFDPSGRQRCSLGTINRQLRGTAVSPGA